MATSFYTNLDLKGNQVTGLGTPTAASDAATKQYVDGLSQGLDIKASVKAATTGPITLENTQSIDGVSLSVDDRVLVKDQSTASENGIYVVQSASWVRATDATVSGTNTLTLGSFTFVEGGSTNKGRGYVYSDANTWTQFSESTVLTAGTGITVSGQTISINTTWTGQSAITTLGTISTGTWNGSVIGVAYGGTGANTLTGYVKGNGTSALTASESIPAQDVTGRKLSASYTVPVGSNAQVISTTSLNSTIRGEATVQLFDASGNQVFADVKVEADKVTINTINNSTETFSLKYVIAV